MLVLLLPIFIFTYIYYSNIMADIEEQNSEVYFQKVQKVGETIDNKFSDMREMAVRISVTPWAKKIMNIDRDLDEKMDFYSLNYNDISRELSNYIALNGLLKEISVVFPYCNTIIVSNGRYKFDEYFNSVEYEDNIMQKEVLSKINQYSFFEFLPLKKVRFWGRESKVVTIVHSLLYSTEVPRASLLMYFNEEAVVKFIKDMSIDNESSISVVDDNDMELGNGNNEKIMDEKLLEMLHSGKSGVQMHQDKENNIYVFRSTIVPLNYVFSYPREAAEIKIIKTQKTISLAVILIVSLGFVIAAAFSLGYYNPLRKVVLYATKKTSGDLNKTNKETDFEIIEKSIDLLDKQKEIACQKLLKYEVIAKESTLNKLIKGIFKANEEERMILKDIGILECYSFGVILIKAFKDEGKAIDKDKRLLKNYYKLDMINIITNILSEYNFDDIGTHIIEIDPLSFAVLNCFDEKDGDYEKKMHDISDALSKKIIQTQGTGFHVVEGDVRKGISGISKSYQMAEKLLEWIVFTGDESKENIKKYIATSKAFYFFPIEWKSQIINHLKNGDKEEIENFIHEIKHENYVKRNLDFNMRKRLLTGIIETGMQVIDELDIKNLVYEEEYEKVIATCSETEMWEYVDKFFCDICVTVASFRSNKISDLNNKITQYVCDNYISHDISLKLISEKFNIPEFSISKIIKNSLGISFVDFVGRKRIEKAKELLCTTDKEIYVISDEVGFDNDTTFRRRFKSYEGISPQEYRVNNRMSVI